ncbi:MAG: hypothetical protein R2748_14765 [Bryobacterales bacterium]
MGHLLQMCMQMQGLAVTCGATPGGMVICQGDLDAVPLENASDAYWWWCRTRKTVRISRGLSRSMGLGMMAALEQSVQIIRARGGDFDLARIPPDDLGDL